MNPRPHRRPERHPQSNQPSRDTSWEKSADWYDRIIGERGSEIYQRVVIPGALALLDPKAGEAALDLGCGQGVFSRALAARGARVTGIDLSAALIERARKYAAGPGPRHPQSPRQHQHQQQPAQGPAIRYLVRDAAGIRDLGAFDCISAILSLQNMEHLEAVCQACAAALQPGGRMLWVMNHPCFRIPRQSSWGFEEARKIQYRRVDAYASPLSIPIVMHPGKHDSEATVSFHKSLSDLLAPAFAAGLTLSSLAEWFSDKQSQPGSRARAENRARKEFPLFLALVWKKGG